MHIAFVDIVYDYTADRPYQDQPLGGTTSAICFIAEQLVKAGIPCTIYNKIAAPQTVLGIEAKPLDALIDDRYDPKYTAFIFCGRWVDWMVQSIREATKVPLIAWMHESLMVEPLTAPLRMLDGIIFISEWQRRTNQAYVPAHYKQTIIKSGMNPDFLTLFKKDESILSAKSRPPILLYVGVTPRGAFHIPSLLDRLRPIRTDFTVEIFCNCSPTRDPVANDKYITWMRGLPNVTHVGQVGQSVYAQRMKRAAVMLSPNPWPETLCMSLIEAMAAGLSVITTNRAVLPETADGYARHIAIDDPDHPLRYDQPMPYETFAKAVDQALTEWINEPGATEKKLRQQIDHFTDFYQWPKKVSAWVEFLSSFG